MSGERMDLFTGTEADPVRARRRMREFRKRVEAPFIRNEHGLWCPNCGEQIADWEWVGDCDCCGYPRPGFDDFEDNRHD